MSIMACCDPNMNIFAALWSSSCNYCTDADYAAQQAQIGQFGASSPGVPNCDPSQGVLANIFSNDCNVAVSDLPSEVLGLPTGIPSWVWWVGLAGGAIFLLRSGK